jgi:hypothetical protein
LLDFELGHLSFELEVNLMNASDYEVPGEGAAWLADVVSTMKTTAVSLAVTHPFCPTGDKRDSL